MNLENTLTKMKPFEEWHQQDMGSHYNRLLDVETAQMMMDIFCMDDVFDSRRQSGTTAIGGTSTWLELRADLELQLRHLRDVGGDVLDELLKQQQSPLCPKRSTAQQFRKTVITAVFHHLFKWNVVACEQGHATNACRHYAIFASAEDAINAHKSIGQHGKFLHSPNWITAHWPSFHYGRC